MKGRLGGCASRVPDGHEGSRSVWDGKDAATVPPSPVEGYVRRGDWGDAREGSPTAAKGRLGRQGRCDGSRRGDWNFSFGGMRGRGRLEGRLDAMFREDA